MGPTPDHWHSAPEVVPETGLYVVRDDFPEPVNSADINHNQWPQHPETNYPEGQHLGGYFAEGKKAHHTEKDLPEAVPPEAVPPEAGTRKRLWGLASRTSWILFSIAAVVIVGAAVGVGVGVSISNRSQSTESSSASPAFSSTTTPTSLGVVSTSLSSSASDAPTITSAQSTTSVTTTDVVGPSSTLYRDCPSSDKTLHDVTFGNDTYVFRKFCSTVLVSIRGENDNLVSTPSTNLNSCINECAKYNYKSASEIASGKSDACNTVCWWNNFNTQYPGQCWGFTTQNSSAGEFQFETQLICDSAGWINET
ncbi:hypothetical protein INS49_014936 [Diaporthe citri]|uniref:uncharacterized protein n=1 Tax=Diaporthe citri TaxID=83186 RepID=UPI001C8263FC|nr:uncharacterized protein INS49_014936 [Diaporthe citri]KAG6357059.1 hypothetical protein INS49_014936 [Diaporthe citri]